MKLVIILIGLFGCLPFALATDAASKEAMTQTQQDLKDPVARKKMLTTKDARDADAAASALAGDSKNLDEMYGISADLIGIIGEQAQGDPKKMQDLLEKAQKDPAGFLKSLPPEQQEKIHQLSKKIEKKSLNKEAPPKH